MTKNGGSGATILIVGDETNILSAIEDAITGRLPECEVFTAGDGDEAMAIAADRSVDAALIDACKPQTGGIELCRQLRSNSATAHIAIILMTDRNADPGDKESGLGAGADDFLGVPIDQAELVARVSSIIRIKQSEDKFRRLFEQSNDAIFIHSPEGEILDINERACQLLGWTRDQLLAMSVPQLHPESELERAHEAMKNMGDRESVCLESVFRRADGELIDVEISARIVDPAAGTIQGVARDITARKRLEETLRAERDFAEGMIEAAQAIVLVLDSQGRIVRFNPYMEKISGYNLDEVRGKDWFSTFLPDRDHEQIRKVFASAISDIRTQGNVNSILTKTGQERRIEWYDKTLKDASGDVMGILAIGHDITQRERTAELLRASEATNRSLLEGSPVCNKIIDLDFKLRYMSAAGVRELKIPDIQPYYGQTYPPEFYPESMRAPLVEALKLAMAGLTSTVEAPVRDMEGDIVWYHTTFVPALDSHGRIKHIIGASVNITDRKRAEQTLLDSEERYRQVVSTTTDAVMIFDAKTRKFIDVNEACTTLYGYSRREFLNMRQDDITAELAESELAIQRTVSGQLNRVPLRYHMKRDGTTFPVEISASTFDLAGRQVVCGLIRDVTEQKRAEAQLMVSEERFRALAMSAPTGIFQTDSEGKGVYVNRKICQLTGLDPKVHHGDGWIEAVHPADRQHTRQAWRRTVRGESDFQGEFRFASEDGQVTWVSSSVARITDPDGAVEGFIGTLTDITERKRAEETLRQNEEKYRTLFENMAQGAFYQRKDGLLLDVNTAALEMLGVSRDEFIGKTATENPQPIIREDGSTYQYHEYASTRALETGKPVRNEIGGFYNQRTSSYVWLNVNAIPQFRPGETEPYQVFVTLHNITERRNLEAQLRQAQKMEAVGRLAGGIAHDFRNQLTIITSYSDWLLSHLDEDGDHARYVRYILDAADKSSRLTGHMLAFSRRETLAPTVVAPMTLIDGLLEPLKHLVGENMHIEASGADNLDNICIDTAQFENMMVNLAINARDAMCEGGQLKIDVANVDLNAEHTRRNIDAQAGRYVMITVSDTGSGMDDETQRNAFDPFFTTKPVGHGTGLGLSMVYGFVRQSGGAITIDSEPGRGTTFTIYLPTTTQAIDKPLTNEGQPTGDRAITGTILAVEDDDDLRNMLAAILRQRGYTVMEAENAGQGLPLGENHEGRIDLLIADVVMPGNSGVDLARDLKKSRPEMAVLFISGYGDSELLTQGLADCNAELLVKPFGANELLEAVNRILA